MNDPERDGGRRSRRRAAGAALLLAVLAALSYGRTLDAPFVFDDLNAIVDNPHLRSLWPLNRSMSAPPQATVDGRPVVALSLAVNHAISGLEPWSYRLGNIVIHGLVGLLLWAVLRRTLEGGRFADAVDPPGGAWALAVAAIWLVHPLHTEVVTYVSTRTESLMALHFMLALYALIRCAEGGRRRSGWAVLCVTASALAMGCKEVAASLPPLLLLYDGVFLAAGFGDALRRRWRLHLAVAATWTVLAVLVASGPRSGTVGFSFADVGPLDYLRTQAGVIWHYLRLVVWPNPLVLDYHGWPVARSLTMPLALGMLSLGALAAASLWAVARRSWLGFVGCWFFAVLAPSSSIVPITTEIAAERRMYLPLVAPLVLLAALAWRLAAGRRPSHPDRVVAMAAAPVVVVLALLTVDRNLDYRDPVALWSDTVAKRPDNPRARSNLGAALAEAGRTGEAAEQLEAALRLDPGALRAAENLALIRLEEGRLDEAMPLLERGVELAPSDGVSRLNLAKGLMLAGDAGRAAAELREAARLMPEHPLPRLRLGWLLAAQGLGGEASEQFREALRLDPANNDAAAGLAALEGAAPGVVGDGPVSRTTTPITAPATGRTGLLLAQARLESRADASGARRIVPGPARLTIVRPGEAGWTTEVLEDPESDVFHGARAFDLAGEAPGVLTVAGNPAPAPALLKLWRQGAAGWTATTVASATFGHRFNRFRDFEIADLDGDGIPELVVGSHDRGVVGVLRRERDHQWVVTMIDEAPRTFVHEIEVGDVDGDGRPELFAASSAPSGRDGGSQPGRIATYRQADGGWRSSVVAAWDDRHAKEILLADVEGRGCPDLFAAVESPSPAAGGSSPTARTTTLTRYRIVGGGWEPRDLVVLPSDSCRSLAVGDVDGDHGPEIVAACSRAGLFLLRPGGESWQASLLDAGSTAVELAMTVADLDGDGGDEIYVAADDQRVLRRYRFSGGAFRRSDLAALGDTDMTFSVAAWPEPGAVD